MHFNNRVFGKIDKLTKSLFKHIFDDSPVNPPPPDTSIRITDSSDIRVTDSNDRRITD